MQFIVIYLYKQAPASSPPANGENGGGESGGGGNAKYSDINTILDQILNITDQSLDEAQVSSRWSHLKIG